MKIKKSVCCEKTATKERRSGGIWSGILFGILPHSFCVAFALFSIIGAVAFTAFFKKFLLIPYFVHFLVLISLLLVTISAVIYLKKCNCLCVAGIKNKWKYISTIYSITVLINLLMFFAIIPALANVGSKESKNLENNLSSLSINVEIPCSGHATLIMDELKKDNGVDWVKFDMPNAFEIKYDSEKTSPKEIISLEIFKTYPVTIN